MTIVVGYLPAKGGRASLDLAAVLARSGLAEPVAVVTVVAQHWAAPSLAKVDAEFVAWTHQTGEQALDQARALFRRQVAGRHRPRSTGAEGGFVPPRSPQACGESAATCWCSARRRTAGWDRSSWDPPRAPAALLRGVDRYRACGLGPPRAPPRPADLRLLRDRGRRRPADRHRADERPDGLGAAGRHLGVRGRTMYPPEVGLHAEDVVLQQWREQVQAAQESAVRPVGRPRSGPPAVRPK